MDGSMDEAVRRSRATRSGPHIRLAADIGGTFTDIAVFDERAGVLVENRDVGECAADIGGEADVRS